ncbi:hypothetical protein [uncultured Sphingomonas sp.]|uniref:hypothetical protein n=1 Tax=uncultured Sphingomonas sp. TaxID=158754 RepID=UPI0035CACC9A
MSGAAVAVLVAKARRRIIRRFDEAGAHSAPTAIAFTPRDRLIDRRMFARLQRDGALVESAPGRFYLDAEGLDRFRSAQRRRVGGVLALAAAAVGAIIALA